MEQNDYQNMQQNGTPSEVQSPAPPAPEIYQNSPYYQPAPKQESTGLAVASMVLGIISLVLSCLVTVSAICSLLALIFGISSLCSHKGGKGMAVAGIVCGAISLVIVLSYAAIWQWFLSLFGASWEEIFG